MQREKRTKSGRLLEIDFYPVLADGRRAPSRAPKTKRSTEEQKRYNIKKQIKNFVRVVNANFFTGDVWMHPTFAPKNACFTIEDAKREVANYFRRVKYTREALLRRLRAELRKNTDNSTLKARVKKLSAPFRYAYRIAESTYKRGNKKGQVSFHFHIFMTGGLEREFLEELWTLGAANADRYRPDLFGPETAALYTAKVSEGELKFGYSKNLVRPEVLEPIDGEITARGVERLATLHIDDAKYWERRYRGYKFMRCYARYNEYNGFWYVTAVMYKPENPDAELPEWKPREWMDEG